MSGKTTVAPLVNPRDTACEGRDENSIYLVNTVLGVESIAGERVFTPLDNLEVASLLGKHPQVALFMADAAIALLYCLDFRQLNLIYECLAVAIAAICAKRLPRVFGGHFGDLETRNWPMDSKEDTTKRTGRFDDLYIGKMLFKQRPPTPSQGDGPGKTLFVFW